MLPGGQTTLKARPMTLSSGTVPPPGSPVWARESAEASRWSPITQSRPAGTVTSNVASEGTLPGKTYSASSRAVPLTVTRPLGSQQTTRSPGTPITRLMKSFSPGGATPTAAPTERSPRTTGLLDSSTWTSGVKESRPLNTTTSPRWMSWKR